MKLPPSLSQTLEKLQNEKKRIVLVTGVFDLLHSEHQLFLQKAKAVGDYLIVGIESDVRVKHIKGDERPINSQEKRLRAVKKLSFVDAAFILPEEFSKPADHEALIAKIKPTFLAVSSHSSHLEAKKRILQKYGGDVKIVHQFNPDVSTTKIVESLKVKK